MEINSLAPGRRVTRADQEIVENRARRSASAHSISAKNESSWGAVHKIPVNVVVIHVGMDDVAGARSDKQPIQMVWCARWKEPAGPIGHFVLINIHVIVTADVHHPAVVAKKIVVIIDAGSRFTVGASCRTDHKTWPF